MLLAKSSAIFTAVAVLVVCGCPPSPPPVPPPNPSADAGAGRPPQATSRWRATSFFRATEGCTQSWTCDCSKATARDGCHVEPTPDTTTNGACAADTGPVNGCTRCMALEPPGACTCRPVCP